MYERYAALKDAAGLETVCNATVLVRENEHDVTRLAASCTESPFEPLQPDSLLVRYPFTRLSLPLIQSVLEKFITMFLKLLVAAAALVVVLVVGVVVIVAGTAILTVVSPAQEGVLVLLIAGSFRVHVESGGWDGTDESPTPPVDVIPLDGILGGERTGSTS